LRHQGDDAEKNDEDGRDNTRSESLEAVPTASQFTSSLSFEPDELTNTLRLPARFAGDIDVLGCAHLLRSP
jgi:hypothetical protein